MRRAIGVGLGSVGRQVTRIFLGLALTLACTACPGLAWTARMCAENQSGQCRRVDNLQPHKYAVKSANVGPVSGTQDVQVKERACDNGIGEVDVQVVDNDDLNVTIYCLVDRPSGTMTLPGTRTDASAPSSSSH